MLTVVEIWPVSRHPEVVTSRYAQIDFTGTPMSWYVRYLGSDHQSCAFENNCLQEQCVMNKAGSSMDALVDKMFRGSGYRCHEWLKVIAAQCSGVGIGSEAGMCRS
ncbi:hypothetical protein NPIL_111901 [Nephila pilipes]|uniref:Uncharacterized protein n=1 Tax=Nephila pilipes TaxID=299642 RepID=A0A8X6PU85_NEPPI|nr:hypothetical protein NPIL_111901 [Nephila pilipes]